MYRSYWKLLEKPFENTPDPRFLYKSAEILETYSRLLYAVRSNRGAVILTGDSGCGKTLLSRALIQELDPEKTDVALLANPCQNPEELLREILFQTGEGERTAEQRSQILHRLNALLYENFSAGKETVVVLDEAQLLEDDPTLDTYDSLSAAAWNVFETADQSKPNSDLLIQAITGVTRSFREDDSLLTESVRQRNEEQSWVVRTANVAALSVRLAIELKFNERQSLAFGMCALVHDIGMLTVPEEILEKPDLTTEEFQLLRNHPFESQRMVDQFGGQFSWMGKVAVQVTSAGTAQATPFGSIWTLASALKIGIGCQTDETMKLKDPIRMTVNSTIPLRRRRIRQ